MKSNANKVRLIVSLSMFLSGIAFGQTEQIKTVNAWDNFLNPTHSGLIIVIVLLLIVIAVLSNLLKALAKQYTNIEIKKHDGKLVKPKNEIKSTWIKGASVLALLILSGTTAFAQDAATTAPVAATYPHTPTINPFVIICLLFIVIEFAVIIGLISSIKRLFKANGLMADAVILEQTAIEAKVIKERKPSFMQKWLTKAVPVEQEEAIVFDHEYDGIRELDNSLPPWWLYGFYISIIFAAVYLIHYHVISTGDLQAAEYKQELADADTKKAELMKKMADKGEVLVNEDNVTLLVDAASIANGKLTYDNMCATCHGNNAQGNIGPNLTDEYWLYGGGIKNVFKTITNGTSNGMQSWKSQLSPNTIQLVGSYIKSLKGSNPAGAKAPQGDLWKDEVASKDTAVINTDSLVVVKKAVGVN